VRVVGDSTPVVRAILPRTDGGIHLRLDVLLDGEEIARADPPAAVADARDVIVIGSSGARSSRTTLLGEIENLAVC
jgi:hypothetical protein